MDYSDLDMSLRLVEIWYDMTWAFFMSTNVENENVTDNRPRFCTSADGALSLACMVGGHEVVEVLLEHGASLTTAGNDGFTPLMGANTTISPLVMRVLLDSVVSAWGRKRRSGVSGGKEEEEEEHEAERAQRINLVLNARARNGLTARLIAIRKKNSVSASLLLQAGTNPF